MDPKLKQWIEIFKRDTSLSAEHSDRDTCGYLSSESSRMTRLGTAKVCCLCSAPPEKSMQLQGWCPRSPLWNLGSVQSISLCLYLPLPVCFSVFPCGWVHQRLRNCPTSKLLRACTSEVHPTSPPGFCWTFYTRSTFVLSELILMYSCLHQCVSKSYVPISNQPCSRLHRFLAAF